MSGVEWTIKGRDFTNCNCAYGCPCQFNALPTHGNCTAVVGMEIESGHHGQTRLDGLKFVGVFSWPGPIHFGGGQAVIVIDERSDEAQREALLRILAGEDTEPGATIFQVFSSVIDKIYDPIFAPITFEIDVERRRAKIEVAGVISARGEPIVNPVTQQEFRGRIDLPNGFEYRVAEAGRGWATTSGPIELHLADSHAHFAPIHMSQSGVLS